MKCHIQDARIGSSVQNATSSVSWAGLRLYAAARTRRVMLRTKWTVRHLGFDPTRKTSAKQEKWDNSVFVPKTQKSALSCIFWRIFWLVPARKCACWAFVGLPQTLRQLFHLHFSFIHFVYQFQQFSAASALFSLLLRFINSTNMNFMSRIRFYSTPTTAPSTSDSSFRHVSGKQTINQNKLIEKLVSSKTTSAEFCQPELTSLTKTDWSYSALLNRAWFQAIHSLVMHIYGFRLSIIWTSMVQIMVSRNP